MPKSTIRQKKLNKATIRAEKLGLIKQYKGGSELPKDNLPFNRVTEFFKKEGDLYVNIHTKQVFTEEELNIRKANNTNAVLRIVVFKNYNTPDNY